MEKRELKFKTFRFVIVHHTFLCLFPWKALKFSLFDQLSFSHKLNIGLYGILGFLKNIYRLEYDSSSNKLMVFHIWGLGYHHFVTEVLLKLAVHKQSLGEYQILIPKNSPDYVIDAMRIMGIDSYISLERPTLFRTLTMIENPNSGFFHSSHLKRLREEFIPKIIKSESNFSKIYISRSKSRGRKVKNEAELKKLLIRKGFLIIYPEDMNFTEQIELFSQADYLISIHGAGLTNMVFMKENSKIIELIPAPSKYDTYPINHCYQNLALALDFNYKNISCHRIDEKIQFDICDIHVNLLEFDIII